MISIGHQTKGVIVHVCSEVSPSLLPAINKEYTEFKLPLTGNYQP